MKTIIISGPNTVGKGTVLDGVIQKGEGRIKKVVRYTTREKGMSEIDGVTYKFINECDFEEMIKQSSLVEFTRFNHGYYGTKLDDILNLLRDSQIPIIDLDVPSGIRVQEQLNAIGISAVRYFVSPISQELLQQEGGIDLALDEIKRRIISRARGFDVDESVIAHKLSVAKEQIISHANYEFYLDNSYGKLDLSINEVDLHTLDKFTDSSELNNSIF